MRRLQTPAGRRWIRRVDSRQIEVERGIHDSHAKHLGPQEIHRGTRELRVRREHTGELRPRIPGRIRTLTGADPTDASGALALEVGVLGARLLGWPVAGEPA